MDEAWSKRTTISNLEQCFDNTKANLFNSGLVIDHKVRN
jgi:hypothetical protein